MYVCLPELQRKMCVNVGGMLLCVAVQYHFGGGFFFVVLYANLIVYLNICIINYSYLQKKNKREYRELFINKMKEKKYVY